MQLQEARDSPAGNRQPLLADTASGPPTDKVAPAEFIRKLRPRQLTILDVLPFWILEILCWLVGLGCFAGCCTLFLEIRW